jgi:HlyD family secretion protein
MKSITQKIFSYVGSHKVISILAALVVIAGGYYVFVSSGTTQTTYGIATVATSTLVTSVSGTGQVSGQNQINVLPQASGQVVAVDVVSGQRVAAGQTIAVLDQQSARLGLAQAQASLQTAQANYDKLMAGITPQSLAVDKLSVTLAQNALANAYQNLLMQMQSSYTQVDGIVRNQLDPLFSNGQSANPTLTFQTSDTQAGIDASWSRVQVGADLNAWQALLGTVSATSSPAQFDAAVAQSQAYLSAARDVSNHLMDALTSAITMPGFTASTIANDKSTVDSARSSINQIISGLVSSYQSARNAELSLQQAQASLAVQIPPPQQEDIETAQAQITSAKAQLQSAQNTFNNTIITAPFSGQIAALNVQVGDQASSGSAVATLVSQKKIAQISLNEVDVVNVQVGEKATLTFDAVDGLSIAGTVAEVDAVGTATQGVVNYTAKIEFDTQDPRIKSGMSVTADIVTKVDQNVLTVPNGAVKTQGSQSYVLVLDKNALMPASSSSAMYISTTAPRRQVVTVGDANDTDTEITSGGRRIPRARQIMHAYD